MPNPDKLIAVVKRMNDKISKDGKQINIYRKKYITESELKKAREEVKAKSDEMIAKGEEVAKLLEAKQENAVEDAEIIES